ncbi:hypothetical protein HNR46_003414 [Haloferula luteola]|uniref:FG-GAP repeat protein n=1 Tax=Haloferula luteola TaxID=595692 RepID=A0A840VH45_9BACT|nr:VCBS repeat-containing protein [Haloferula luteola]MBB5353160.1 hypothetical protein [Haloferula luteola]
MNPSILTPCLLLSSPLVHADLQITWEQPIKGTSAFANALGDIDDDGDIDACMAQFTSEGHVLVNDGTGNFHLSPTAATLPSAGDIALGDLDGDGDLDLFFARHFSPCAVWLNDGAGNFTDSGQTIGGFYSRRTLALGDLDHDGDLDAVVPANDSNQPCEVWLNDGHGLFSNSGQILGMQYTQGCALIDVNHDTHLDLALANNGANTLWMNDGTGVFTLAGTSLGSKSSFDIDFADLNGDTHPDAFISNGHSSDNANEVWFNDGAGHFSDSGQSLGGQYSYSTVLTDVDTDGDLDAVVGNTTAEANQVWRNNGSGTFSLLAVTLGTQNAFDVDTADLDGDGDNDFFLTVNGFPSEVWMRIPVSEGGPIADSGQRLGGSEGNCVATFDFDGDGDLDVAVGTIEGTVQLLANDGRGQFTEIGTLPHDNNPINNALGVGDFNGDTFLDLLVINSSASPDRLWLNDGAGHFTAAAQEIGSDSGGAVAVIDLDDDGDLDAVVGNLNYFATPGQNKIYRNHGSGRFSIIDALGTGSTYALTFGDLNGDTHPDFIVGNYDQGTTIWLNSGSNSFTSTGQALGSGETYDLQLGDFDGDLDLDLLQVNGNAPSILWINDGRGSFSASPQVFTGNYGRSAVAYDADGDTDLDIWLAQGSLTEAADTLWINDGHGTFTRADLSIRPQYTRDVVAADFDANGSVDIFAASFLGDHILWSQVDTTTVESYAASFGLSGNDTLPDADPDHDGVPNFEEMAFNMNPSISDFQRVSDIVTATSGVPTLTIEAAGNSHRLVAKSIRRIGSGLFRYEMEYATDLQFQPVTTGVTEVTFPLNAQYERVEFHYLLHVGLPGEFGRFAVRYDP